MESLAEQKFTVQLSSLEQHCLREYIVRSIQIAIKDPDELAEAIKKTLELLEKTEWVMTYEEIETILIYLHHGAKHFYQQFKQEQSSKQSSGYQYLSQTSDIVNLQNQLQRNSYNNDKLSWLEVASSTNRGAEWLRTFFNLFS